MHNRIDELASIVDHFGQDKDKDAQISELIETIAKNDEIREEQANFLKLNIERCHENVLMCWTDLGVAQTEYNDTIKDFKIMIKKMTKTCEILQKRSNAKFEVVDSRFEKLEIQIEYITAGIRDLKIYNSLKILII